MKKVTLAFFLAFALTVGVAVTGCVQMPTEKQSISDMRPQVSFKVGDDRFLNARVQIDELDAGLVSDFIDGVAAMRIRPGTHLVRVTFGTDIVLEEKFYLGDGVNRAFVLR